MTDQSLTDEDLARIDRELTDAVERDGELYLAIEAPKDMRRLLTEVDRLRKILGYVEVPDGEHEEVHVDRLQVMLRSCTAQRDRLESNANTVRKLHQPIERSDGQLICRLCGDMWLPCRTTQAINGNWTAEIFPEEQP